MDGEALMLKLEKKRGNGRDDYPVRMMWNLIIAMLVVVNMLKNEPAITVSDISKQSGIPIRSVERIISQLKQDGIVERVGAKKAGYWRVLPDE